MLTINPDLHHCTLVLVIRDRPIEVGSAKPNQIQGRLPKTLCCFKALPRRGKKINKKNKKIKNKL